MIIAHTARATTWDEPWHDEVMRNSDSFVKVKVIENDGTRVKASVITHLAGVRTAEQIELQGYSRLRVLSTSSHSQHELRMPFRTGEVYYLFVKKSEKPDTYQIPTPTSGWAVISNGNVHATYRHSYHRALIPVDIYEKTMPAVFNGSKGLAYDTKFIESFIKEQLSQPVAPLTQGETALAKRFFLQHAALESFYHLGKGADLALLEPFVKSDSYHVQVSACRAVSRIESAPAKEILMKFIEGKGAGFAKVMAVWGLKRTNAKEMIPRLQTYAKTADDEQTGFGGSIMDPRVGTYFPSSVKESINELLKEWLKATPNNAMLRRRVVDIVRGGFWSRVELSSAA